MTTKPTGWDTRTDDERRHDDMMECNDAVARTADEERAWHILNSDPPVCITMTALTDEGEGDGLAALREAVAILRWSADERAFFGPTSHACRAVTAWRVSGLSGSGILRHTDLGLPVMHSGVGVAFRVILPMVSGPGRSTPPGEWGAAFKHIKPEPVAAPPSHPWGIVAKPERRTRAAERGGKAVVLRGPIDDPEEA